MANEENTLKTIQAGKSVSDFLADINYNFETIDENCKTMNSQKQKTITISKNAPISTDGVDGDIWIVYEE